MLEQIDQWDKALVLFLNRHHHPFWDVVMSFVTTKQNWIPLYILLAGYMVYSFRKESWKPLLVIALLVVSSDFVASGIFKPLFARPRPCMDLELKEQLIMLQGCGSPYGFISSHAANSFAIAVFLLLLFASKRWIGISLLIWAALVSFSRLYLSVHYATDLLVGAAVGGLLAWLYFIGMRHFIKPSSFK